MIISNKEKNLLINIAREAIGTMFDGQSPQRPDGDSFPIFKTKSGVFVTLKLNERLRGCIGYIVSDRLLFDTVNDAAINAAGNDPRFPRLSKAEFEKIDLEISILSEPFPLNSYDEIEIGKHGLIIEEGGHRALLLPQVPVEHKMNRDEYLSALCEKAGFFGDLWKQKKLTLSAFTAEVFSEKELIEKE